MCALCWCVLHPRVAAIARAETGRRGRAVECAGRAERAPVASESDPALATPPSVHECSECRRDARRAAPSVRPSSRRAHGGRPRAPARGRVGSRAAREHEGSRGTRIALSAPEDDTVPADEATWCGLAALCGPLGRPWRWLRPGASRDANMYIGCRGHVRWARCRAASSSQRHRRSPVLPALSSEHKLQVLLVQPR